MTDIEIALCEATGDPVRRCGCPDHLGGRAVIDGVTVVSPKTGCGTRNGYLAHRRKNQRPCGRCREANAAHRREHFDGNRERNRAYQKARRLAGIRLQEMYPVMFRRLLNEEMHNADQRLRAERALRDGAEAG
ncbi:hypothetical protein [Actinophytocola sp.]|uniref:hypothetical protein n=1 Tax=Actinophytocola sp. TaxID=1872138 RepID=UPI002D2CF1F6|nr:hypothetical protein [Actinophytocola sp.]HYQ67772.1 hypothetical protein [Actinophytocola sp.]